MYEVRHGLNLLLYLAITDSGFEAFSGIGIAYLTGRGNTEATMINRQNRERGVTMLELIVVLGIGAILLMVAIPSFVRTKAHLNLQGASSALVGDLRTTQANAIRQDATTALTYAGTNKTYQDFCNTNSCLPTDGANNPAASISFNSSGYVAVPAVMPFKVTMMSCQTGEVVIVQVERTGRIRTLTAAPGAC